MKSVTAAELAALGAWRATDVGDRIGAVVFNDTELIDIRPQRSKKTVMSILGTIVRMNHELRSDFPIEPNADMLNRALQKVHNLAPHDVLVVIISDYFGVNNQSERIIAQIAEHNDILGFLVHDPLRLRPPKQRITVSDGTLQMEMDFTNKRIQERVTNDYQEEQDRITHFLRNLSAPLLMVSNKGDVVDQVRRLLGVPNRTKKKMKNG